MSENLAIRAEKYKRNPTLRNRSLLLAREIDRLKQCPENKEFKKILYRAIREIQFVGRNSKKEKRERVRKSLEHYASELDEIMSETRLEKKDVLRILAVFERAKIVVVRERKIKFKARGQHIIKMYFLKKHIDASE